VNQVPQKVVFYTSVLLDHTFAVLRPAESGFCVKGDSRRILSLLAGNKYLLIVGVNNDKPALFRLSGK
jgi:hypothetical protein